jgi:TPR repeat protein
MSRNIFVAIILFILPVFGGACSHVTQSEPTALNQNFVRTSADRETLKKSANAGDGAAAYQLFQYYAFVEFDKAEYSYWLKRAVKLGYRPAIISLGNLLCESSDAQERRRGWKLLREAGVEDPTVIRGKNRATFGLP